MRQLRPDPSARLVDRCEKGVRLIGSLGNEASLKKPAALKQSMDRRQPDEQGNEPVVVEDQLAFIVIGAMTHENRLEVQNGGVVRPVCGDTCH